MGGSFFSIPLGWYWYLVHLSAVFSAVGRQHLSVFEGNLWEYHRDKSWSCQLDAKNDLMFGHLETPFMGWSVALICFARNNIYIYGPRPIYTVNILMVYACVEEEISCQVVLWEFLLGKSWSYWYLTRPRQSLVILSDNTKNVEKNIYRIPSGYVKIAMENCHW